MHCKTHEYTLFCLSFHWWQVPWPRTNPNWEADITKLLKTTTKFKLRGLSAPMRTKHAVTTGWRQHREKPIDAICLKVHLHRTSYSCPRKTMQQLPECPGLENPPSKRAACLWQSDYSLNMMWKGSAFKSRIETSLWLWCARPMRIDLLYICSVDLWEVFDKAWQGLIFIVWDFHFTPGFMGQEMPHKKPNFCNRKLLWTFHPQCAKTFLSTEQFRCKNKLWHVRNILAATVIRCIRSTTNPAMNCTGAKQFVVLEPLQNDSKLHRHIDGIAKGGWGSDPPWIYKTSWKLRNGFHHQTSEGPLRKERNVLIIIGHFKRTQEDSTLAFDLGRF